MELCKFTFTYWSLIMSVLHHESILETFFEEALEEVTNNNPLGFNEEELQFSAEVLAQQRFEEACQ